MWSGSAEGSLPGLHMATFLMYLPRQKRGLGSLPLLFFFLILIKIFFFHLEDLHFFIMLISMSHFPPLGCCFVAYGILTP